MLVQTDIRREGLYGHIGVGLTVMLVATCVMEKNSG